jgi:hypothetical protein
MQHVPLIPYVEKQICRYQQLRKHHCCIQSGFILHQFIQTAIVVLLGLVRKCIYLTPQVPVCFLTQQYDANGNKINMCISSLNQQDMLH